MKKHITHVHTETLGTHTQSHASLRLCLVVLVGVGTLILCPSQFAHSRNRLCERFLGQRTVFFFFGVWLWCPPCLYAVRVLLCVCMCVSMSVCLCVYECDAMCVFCCESFAVRLWLCALLLLLAAAAALLSLLTVLLNCQRAGMQTNISK